MAARRLHHRQRYRGQAFVVAEDCVWEVYHLDQSTRAQHLSELAEVAAAIDAVFKPRKMNIESLGNGIPHLHWWMTPRHEDDPRLSAPIWENLDFLRDMWCEQGFADSAQLEDEHVASVRSLSVEGVVVDLH